VRSISFVFPDPLGSRTPQDYAGFLLNFPVKGRDGSFFFFDFSTRKLPLECEVFTGRALGDEHAILIFETGIGAGDSMTRRLSVIYAARTSREEAMGCE
jgi:hypothetical protein